MAEEWIGVVNSTAPKYLKGADDLTIRKRLLLKMMEKRGLLVMNCNSYEEYYDVQYKEPPVVAYADGQAVQYNRRDLLKQAKIDWRGSISTDAMTVKEKEMNKGDAAIVKRYSRIIPNLVKAQRNKIGTEFYIDGFAAGNENRLCGLASWAGYTSASSLVGDLVAYPSDTYNGLSTAAGVDGTWSTDLTTSPNAAIATDWPEGTGDSEYDYFTPKLVNYTSNAWGTSKVTWADNCEHVLRRTMQWLQHTTGVDGASLVCILAGQLMTEFKDKMSAKNRNLLPHPEARDLGFPDVLNFEGLAIHSEYGIPADYGYVINVDEMELRCLQDRLFKARGPDWDPKEYAWLFSVGFFGNLKCTSPKFFAELYKYAAS